MPVDPHAVARVRWRAAEDQLYPGLLNDPTAYQRGLTALRLVSEELRSRAQDVDGLLAAEADAEGLVAATCPPGVPVPPGLLVAVACGMRDRELSAEREGSRREEAVRAAREAGAPWAVFDGPADAAALTEGRRIVVHIASGVVVEASIDPWSRELPFGLAVSPGGEPQTFADRDAWLAEIARVESVVEAGT